METTMTMGMTMGGGLNIYSSLFYFYANSEGKTDLVSLVPGVDGTDWPIGDNLLDAFDGVADGVEEVTNGGFDTDTSGYVSNNGNSTLTWQPGGTALFENQADWSYIQQVGLSIDPIKRYEISFNIISFSGTMHVGLGASGNIITETGQQSYRVLASDVTSNTSFQIRPNATGLMSCEIDNISVKEVSDATAKTTVFWTPGYNAGEQGTDITILDIDGTGNFLIHDDANNLIEVTDGTNTVTAPLTAVSGTEYEIILNYGDNDGSPEMQLTINGASSAAGTFEGTFSPGDTFVIDWDNALYDISLVKIERSSNFPDTDETVVTMDGEIATMDGEVVTMGS